MQERPSTDLAALYLAAHNFHIGNFRDIFAASKPVFDLSVPGIWREQAAGLGYDGDLFYPYVYAPLWSAVFAPLTRFLDFGAFEWLAGFINPLILAASAVVAHRLARPAMSLAPWLLISLGFVTITTFGFQALEQNQLQLVVTLLILLAFERERAGSHRVAGITLALAASIKLYPALLVILWIATRNGRALAWFALAGAILATGSVLLAGWPLHAEFIETVRLISNSAAIAQNLFTLDGMIAQYVHWETLAEPGYAGRSEIGVLVTGTKPILLRLADKAILILGLASYYLAFSRAKSGTAIAAGLLPAFLIFISITSPLSWTYHYLTVALLLPCLLDRPRSGVPILLAFAVVFSVDISWSYNSLPTTVVVGQILGSIALFSLMLVFMCRAASISKAHELRQAKAP